MCPEGTFNFGNEHHEFKTKRESLGASCASRLPRGRCLIFGTPSPQIREGRGTADRGGPVLGLGVVCVVWTTPVGVFALALYPSPLRGESGSFPPRLRAGTSGFLLAGWAVGGVTVCTAHPPAKFFLERGSPAGRGCGRCCCAGPSRKIREGPSALGRFRPSGPRSLRGRGRRSFLSSTLPGVHKGAPGHPVPALYGGDERMSGPSRSLMRTTSFLCFFGGGGVRCAGPASLPAGCLGWWGDTSRLIRVLGYRVGSRWLASRHPLLGRHPWRRYRFRMVIHLLSEPFQTFSPGP